MELISNLFDLIVTVLSGLGDFFETIVDFISDMFKAANELISGGEVILGVIALLLIIKVVSIIRNLI